MVGATEGPSPGEAPGEDVDDPRDNPQPFDDPPRENIYMRNLGEAIYKAKSNPLINLDPVAALADIVTRLQEFNTSPSPNWDRVPLLALSEWLIDAISICDPDKLGRFADLTRRIEVMLPKMLRELPPRPSGRPSAAVVLKDVITGELGGILKGKTSTHTTSSHEEKRAEDVMNRSDLSSIGGFVRAIQHVSERFFSNWLEARKVEYFVFRLKTLKIDDVDPDLVSAHRRFAASDFVPPRDLAHLCLILYDLETPEKKLSECRKVYDLANERHDFTQVDPTATKLIDRVVEIDELLSRIWELRRTSQETKRDFLRHLKIEERHTCCDLSVLTTSLLEAWGLGKLSAEFQAEIQGMLERYRNTMSISQQIDERYKAGSLRELWEKSGVKEKIDAVASVRRSEGRMRAKALGTTPILAAYEPYQTNQANEPNQHQVYQEYEEEDWEEDWGVFAISEADVNCDFCGVKGHRILTCHKAKPTLDLIAKTIKEAPFVTGGGEPQKLSRLLNAVRSSLGLPYPTFRRTGRFRGGAEGNRNARQ